MLCLPAETENLKEKGKNSEHLTEEIQKQGMYNDGQEDQGLHNFLLEKITLEQTRELMMWSQLRLYTNVI